MCVFALLLSAANCLNFGMPGLRVREVIEFVIVSVGVSAKEKNVIYYVEKLLSMLIQL